MNWFERMDTRYLNSGKRGMIPSVKLMYAAMFVVAIIGLVWSD